jgi:hypothetical protein
MPAVEAAAHFARGPSRGRLPQMALHTQEAACVHRSRLFSDPFAKRGARRSPNAGTAALFHVIGFL